MKIKDCWKWAAMDRNRDWLVFEDKPLQDEEGYWNSNGSNWEEANDTVIDFPKVSNWKNSLHQIIDGELVPYHELKVDDKVMVRIDNKDPWRKRHFKRFTKEGKIVCFDSYGTSWTNWNSDVVWNEWRLPTQEELEGEK